MLVWLRPSPLPMRFMGTKMVCEVCLTSQLLSSTTEARSHAHLGVRSPRHVLQRLELTNLNGGRRTEDIGRLPHQLGGVDLGAGGDDLGLSHALGLCSRGEALLELFTEKDVLQVQESQQAVGAGQQSNAP